MKSRTAFGKSEAALYLADYLMQKGDEHLNSKVSGRLAFFFRQMKEIAGSSLSIDLKVWALNHYHDDFVIKNEEHPLTDDELVTKLMNNVTRGRVREEFKRFREQPLSPQEMTLLGDVIHRMHDVATNLN